MKKLILLGLLAAMPLAGVAAQDTGAGPMPGGPGMGEHGMGHGGHPPGPPPAFRTACQGKKAGDKVTVETPRGPLQGSCELMFRPDTPPGRGPQDDASGPNGRSAQKPAPR
jgi:hypothetical protein